MNGSPAFEAGVVDALIKVAEVAKAMTTETKAVTKPKTKKPSRKLGLGEETMEMGETKINKHPMAQPQKPPRY
jgi:hypothetical protein